MSNHRLTLVRLEKQQRSLNNDPIPNLLVKRKGLLNFHFCIYGLEGSYNGGFYHGVLELASDYPFSPPQLRFFTQSGRFEINKPICTSFTNFHKEQWTSAWNVRTMLLGVISFMTSSEGGYGSINEPQQKKRTLAQRSLPRNMQSQQFMELFKEGLKQLPLPSQIALTLKTITDGPSNEVQVKQKDGKNSGVSILVFLLVSLCIIYFWFGESLDNMVKNQF